MSRSQQQNYYTNPVFSQQSEFFHGQQQRRALSPPKRQNSFRQPPVGAQTTYPTCDSTLRQDLPPKPGPKPKKIEEDASYEYGEQEFYEEIIVDDSGYVKDKKVVVVHSPTKPIMRYVDVDNKNRYELSGNYNNNGGNRYEEIPELGQNQKTQKYVKHRYEYIPMQDQEISPQRPKMKPNEYPPKYTTIVHPEVEEETELLNKSTRYALIPVNNNIPRNQTNRYEYISEDQNPRYQQQVLVSPRLARKPPNPTATQKLHELLTTPKKSSQRPHQTGTPTKDPFLTPPKTDRQHPKSQQKLNYSLASRQLMVQDKRHTAVIAPICSSPVQSVYSETTYSNSNKTESWMNLSINKQPVQSTLTVAAVMMILCGGVTSGLCFYMVSILGRLYYLDFGIVSGFACLLLGLLGYRSRNCYWLPNRNYISGYIVLSAFSLLTCVGLLVLLFEQPKPGTPLADMTSGGVCGISVLSLILASTGVVASYCCKYPPPDNRVQHCARGFTV